MQVILNGVSIGIPRPASIVNGLARERATAAAPVLEEFAIQVVSADTRICPRAANK